MTYDDMQPERRADDELRQRFNAAVTAAARDAAQEVAQISRRRQVWQSVVLAVVAMSVIGIGVLIGIRNSERAFGARRAVYDCTLFRETAGIMGDFVQSDANLRATQNKRPVTAELLKQFARVLRRDTLLKASAANTRDSERIIAQWQQDASKLRRLAGTHCEQNLGG